MSNENVTEVMDPKQERLSNAAAIGAAIDACCKKEEYLNELRNPLNNDVPWLFDDLPLPMYGAHSGCTIDDFIMFFAKIYTKSGGGALDRQIESGWGDMFRDRGIETYTRLLTWYFSNGIKVDHINSFSNLADVVYKAATTFFAKHKAEIIGKVKEIMKLWLEHNLI